MAPFNRRRREQQRRDRSVTPSDVEVEANDEYKDLTFCNMLWTMKKLKFPFLSAILALYGLLYSATILSSHGLSAERVKVPTLMDLVTIATLCLSAFGSVMILSGLLLRRRQYLIRACFYPLPELVRCIVVHFIIGSSGRHFGTEMIDEQLVMGVAGYVIVSFCVHSLTAFLMSSEYLVDIRF